MRKLAEKIYLRLLRIEGLYALLTCLAFFATLSKSLAQGYYMLVPGILSLISLAAALVYLIPRLTPKWLTHPAGFKSGAATLLIHTLMPLFMMLTTYSVVLAFAIPEPTSQTVAVSLAVLHFVLAGLLWWLAVFLLIIPGNKGPAPATSLDDPNLSAA